MKYHILMADVRDTSGRRKNPKWAGLYPTVFKEVLERGVITIWLLSGISSLLVVFGTIKLGTRLSDNKEMKNDYFLIGNLSTILLAVIYSNLILRIMWYTCLAGNRPNDVFNRPAFLDFGAFWKLLLQKKSTIAATWFISFTFATAHLFFAAA